MKQMIQPKPQQAYREATGASITFYGIGFTVVAQITKYLLSLFLGHESLKYFFAKLYFLSRNGVAHFLKFCSTGVSVLPTPPIRRPGFFGGLQG